MKKKVIAIVLVSIRCVFGNVLMAQSIDPVSLVVAKVIKAIDLKIQQLQNEAIRLQQAQQVAERALSKAKLDEIRSWGQKQTNLYADYFRELSVVKPVMKALPQVKQVLDLQQQVASEYQRYRHHPSLVTRYETLMAMTLDVSRSLQAVTADASMTMKDAERVKTVLVLRERMRGCLDSIQVLNAQNERMNANRAQLQSDMQTLKRFNGQL